MNEAELAKIKEDALKRYIPIIMDDTLEVIGKELEKLKPTKVLEIGMSRNSARAANSFEA